jgi:hypothetical protein
VKKSHRIHFSVFVSFFSLKIKELLIYSVNVVEIIKILSLCCSFFRYTIPLIMSNAGKNIFQKGAKNTSNFLALLKGERKIKENKHAFSGFFKYNCDDKLHKENTHFNKFFNVYFFRKRGHLIVTHVEAGLVWQETASVLYEGGREQAPPRPKTTFHCLRFIVM